MSSATAAAPSATEATRPRVGGGLAVGILVAGVAFAMRLIPVLRGQGLHSLLTYDGAVYYGAAAGLAHGLLPYRDFLLLHPPGIVLALLPFAALARLVGDANGFAVASVAWMGIGALNAVLVTRILRPAGLVAAAVGGLFYAVFPAVIYVEHAPSLEAVAATCILLAMLLASRWRRRVPVATRTVLLVGALLGVSSGIKIWGVVVVAAVGLWCLLTVGVKRAVLYALGALAGVSAVCLPFFVAAPGPMYRMVVLDQLVRTPSKASSAQRVADIAGVSGWSLPHSTSLLVVAGVLAVVICALALRVRAGRLGVVVLLATGAMLLVTPSWFLHYAGLTAAPAAVVVGSAAGALVGLARWRALRAVVVVAAAAGLTAYAGPALSTTFGKAFPARELAAVMATSPGCVTTDDPQALIQTNLLARNFARGCPLVVDLGGYSYDLPLGVTDHGHREKNKAWQAYALRYLASGGSTLTIRFHSGFGFTPASAKVVHRWPVIGRTPHYVVHAPLARLAPGGS